MSDKNDSGVRVLTLKEKKELINQSYMPQKFIKPQIYRSKHKRNKLEGIAISTSTRHANSTENIRENMIKNLNQPLNSSSINEQMKIETECDDSQNISPQINKQKISAGLNIEFDNNLNSAGNLDTYEGSQYLSIANGKSVKEMTPVEYYWLHKNKKIATQVSSPLASAAITSSSKPHNKSTRINTPEGIRAQREKKTLEKLAKEIQEAEKKREIQEMLKNKFIIPMEDPIDVARRLNKISHKNRNIKLPSLEKSQSKASKKEKKEKELEGHIAASGIYIIKDTNVKMLKMPKYTDFRTNKEERPAYKEESPKKKKIRRHINIAGGNPLSGGPIRNVKRKVQTERK